MPKFKSLIRSVALGSAIFLPYLCNASDAPSSLAEHWDVTWYILVAVVLGCTGLVGLLYRQAIQRIKGVEDTLKLTATKTDIDTIKSNCSIMQTNCPKNATLSKIEESLRQVAMTLSTTSETIQRIFNRQDELRKELPEKYIQRIEYEKRHEILTDTINNGFNTMNQQISDLTKAIYTMQGMKMAMDTLTKKED
jgi:predicted nuclease with TOPRIM domain